MFIILFIILELAFWGAFAFILQDPLWMMSTAISRAFFVVVSLFLFGLSVKGDMDSSIYINDLNDTL